MNSHDHNNNQSAPKDVTELRPKMQLTGRVEKIELFGAVVDIGMDHPALLHISQMSNTHTKSAEVTVQAGDEITVWVLKVNLRSGRVDLTLVEPTAVEWHELKAGQVRDGKVVRLENYGAFVDIGAEREGLVHLRELTNGQVRHPSEVVSVGEKVEAKVTAVDRNKRRVDLSMRALEVEPVDDDDDEGPVVTSLGAALRAAMDADDRKAKRTKRKREKSPRVDANREDLFRRTLDQHFDD